MKVNQSIKCPYCKREILYHGLEAELYSSNPQVVACDSEQGGCDRWFAVSVSLRPYVHVYVMDELKSEA